MKVTNLILTKSFQIDMHYFCYIHIKELWVSG